MRAASLSVLVLLAGCAYSPVVRIAAPAPQAIPAEASYRFVEAGNASERQAQQLLAQRLARFGLRQQSEGSLLVTVSATARSRGVGAYLPGCSGAADWQARSEKRRLFAPAKIKALELAISDRASGALLYRSSASLRSVSMDQKVLARLVEALVPADPRSAPVTAPAAC